MFLKQRLKGAVRDGRYVPSSACHGLRKTLCLDIPLLVKDAVATEPVTLGLTLLLTLPSALLLTFTESQRTVPQRTINDRLMLGHVTPCGGTTDAI